MHITINRNYIRSFNKTMLSGISKTLAWQQRPFPYLDTPRVYKPEETHTEGSSYQTIYIYYIYIANEKTRKSRRHHTDKTIIISIHHTYLDISYWYNHRLNKTHPMRSYIYTAHSCHSWNADVDAPAPSLSYYNFFRWFIGAYCTRDLLHNVRLQHPEPEF